MTEAPGWFSWAVAQSPAHRTLDVDGISIAYRVWGDPEADPVVLIHGGAAHAGWWDHVAPHLVADCRVIAVDLSGHGDSGRRDEYALTTWADEVLQVAAAESTLRPLVIGHSLGGFVALTAARDHGDSMRGAVAIDSPVREVPPESRARLAERGSDRSLRVYPDFETILGRFRTVPEDADRLEYVARYIAERSVREIDGGWSWKFDPHVFLTEHMRLEDLIGITCPVALVRGELGLATRDITADVRSRLGGRAPVTVIPGGGHHLMIDQPVALIAVLQTLIGQWRNP